MLTFTRFLPAALPAALVVAGLLAAAPAQTPGSGPVTVRGAVNRIIRQEAQTVRLLRTYTPRIETYMQEVKPSLELGSVPVKDHYFLGKLNLRSAIQDNSFLSGPGPWRQLVRGLNRDFTGAYLLNPAGFAYMLTPDPGRFDRQHYHFQYIREEFLGSVRCVVFDVWPLEKTMPGAFMGRIWAEDENYHIVRFNGTFLNAPHFDKYFHFDSWRVNVRPGVWLPAYIFSADDLKNGVRFLGHHELRFRAETRLWGYDLQLAQRQETSTDLIIQTPHGQPQATDSDDYSPLESQRLFELDAENNYLDRLQKAGLLAPPGPVDKILETVVNNIEVTNNLNIDPPVRCRVLLTSPMEVFAVGHTIVISRGLIDVLPDEPSLAMVLSRGLAQIALGYQMDMKFGFDDRLIFPDTQSLHRLRLLLKKQDEEAIDRKSVALLEHSPYKNKLGQAGLFLEDLNAHAKELPNLIDARLGNPLGWGGHVRQMTQLMQVAPKLEPRNVHQVAALPLGARIKLNPWDDEITMLKTQPVILLSAREKLPFAVTPLRPYLIRVSSEDVARGAGSAAAVSAGDPAPAAAKPPTGRP